MGNPTERAANTPKLQHRLRDIDPDQQTAWCAACQERVEVTTAGPGRWQCAPANRQRVSAWRAANPGREAAVKAAYKAANLEKYRKMRQAGAIRYSAAHGQEIRDRANAKRERLRAAVFKAYGSRCNCPGCHVIHAVLLTVDHVAGDGAAHRRKMGKSSRDLYRWIERLGFPPDFQLLCGSCNFAKGDKDKCPLAGESH